MMGLNYLFLRYLAQSHPNSSSTALESSNLSVQTSKVYSDLVWFCFRPPSWILLSRLLWSEATPWSPQASFHYFSRPGAHLGPLESLWCPLPRHWQFGLLTYEFCGSFVGASKVRSFFLAVGFAIGRVLSTDQALNGSMLRGVSLLILGLLHFFAFLSRHQIADAVESSV